MFVKGVSKGCSDPQKFSDSDLDPVGTYFTDADRVAFGTKIVTVSKFH